LELLIEGGDALLFIVKAFSCWELTFAADSNSGETLIDGRSSEMTRTPALQTRQNWHNHLPNKTIVM
jgi:hypothetical protein